MIPTKVFLTHGVGRHRERLQSFELALRAAGIAMLNLVSVSSIVPPGCKWWLRKRGSLNFRRGKSHSRSSPASIAANRTA
jgi:arginine decarboxylase